jgi:hypothetical protein
MLRYVLGFFFGLMVGSCSAHAGTCSVVGDSIAEMVQHYLPECSHNTKIGIGSAAVVDRVIPGKDITIVSAGANDPDNPNLKINLALIHAKAGAVIWIAPVNPKARLAAIVMGVTFNESVIAFKPGKDGVHPVNPKALAAAIKAEFQAYDTERALRAAPPPAPVAPPGTDI